MGNLLNQHFGKLKIMMCYLNHRDTAGQDEFERLRPLSYTNVDVLIIAFSTVDHDSFKNALNKVCTLLSSLNL